MIKRYGATVSPCSTPATMSKYSVSPSGERTLYGEKTWRQLHKNAVSNTEQVLEASPHKAAAVRPPTTYHDNYPS